MNKDLIYNAYPYMESEEFILKKPEPEDAADLYELYTNEKLYRYKPGIPLKSMDAVKNVIGHFDRDFIKHKMVFLGIYLKSEDNKMVGIAEIFDIDQRSDLVNIGYTINDKYWGQGIATKTVTQLVKFLFEIIDVNRIQGYIMPVNEKSKNVLKRNGFAYEGTMRQFQLWTGCGIVDLELYALLKSDWKV